MQHLNQQRGMATLLLVLLVGISIMLVTAGFARSLSSKKEASVAAHAQTNAQLMGWTGVSAFREYLLNKGQANLNNITALQGRSVILRSEANQKEITATVTQVKGCTAQATSCQVTANISSNNMRAQAATTIQAVYDLALKNGTVEIAGESNVLSYTGDASFLGAILDSEIPNTKLDLNVDGNVLISSSLTKGFRTKNISELNINSTGNVTLVCTYDDCGDAKININALGYVDISNGGNIGDIYAKNYVRLTTNVVAENIYSGSYVHLTTNSRAQLVHAHGDVLVTNADAGIIHSNANVNLNTTSNAEQIHALGNVTLLVSKVSGDVNARGHVDMTTSEVKGNVKAYRYVALNTSSKVTGSIYAKGEGDGPTSPLLAINSAVSLSLSSVGGSVYLNDNLRLWDITVWPFTPPIRIEGNAYLNASSRVVGETEQIRGQVIKNNNVSHQLNFSIPQVVKPTEIIEYIYDQLDFETKVDVTKYKQDANYIFTMKYGAARVYLNKLKVSGEDTTYIYEDGQQFKVNSSGGKTKINDTGFYLGKYTMHGKEYVGAICETVTDLKNYPNSQLLYKDHQSGHCASEIVGFLPRVSVEFILETNLFNTFGYARDYEFTLPGTWHIRSTQDTSSIDNAAFAPGIFYFEKDHNATTGTVRIVGHYDTRENNLDSAFTNTFLSEGNIEAITNSPRIFSPYNVLRETTAKVICDRELKTTTNGAIGPMSQPRSSDKFLIPTNLCKDENTFSHNMNKNANGEKIILEIENKQVKKLDLGYVALMADQTIRVGACTQVYGDVLAGGALESTALATSEFPFLTCNPNSPNQIVGSVSSGGKKNSLGLKIPNLVGADSRIVVPNQDFTNAKNSDDSTAAAGTLVDGVKLQWSKYN